MEGTLIRSIADQNTRCFELTLSVDAKHDPRPFARVAILYFLMLPAILALIWFVPRLGDPWLGSFEKLATRFASKKGRLLVVVFLGAILARVALLQKVPVPVPDTHDEFSQLLGGDTFTHFPGKTRDRIAVESEMQPALPQTRRS